MTHFPPFSPTFPPRGRGNRGRRARRGILLLEVLIALAIFALAGIGLTLALRQTARLQAQLDQRLRAQLAIANGLAELRAMPLLQAGSYSLPNQPPGVSVTAQVFPVEGLLDQFGNPLPLPPGVTSGPDLATATANAQQQNQTSGAAAANAALPAAPTLFEVRARISVSQLDGAEDPITEEFTFWTHPDATGVVGVSPTAAGAAPVPSA